MPWLYTTLGVVGGLAFLVLLTALICFFKVFYSPRRKPFDPEVYDIPPGREYQERRDIIVSWTKAARSMPHEEITITSFDGLKLVGYYYEYKSGAPMEIIFHGYKGNADRDLSGGVLRCHSLGRNALIVDQRAAGKSEGHVITFGIKERRDAISWVKYARERFGEEQKIIITGVSMGAATVVMAAADPEMPKISSVVADCGYTSAREIISLIIGKMGLPVRILYPFVRLGAGIFGGFKLEEYSPLRAASEARFPIIFIHGDEDDFVPTVMSEKVKDVCATRCALLLVKGAAHGLAYPVDISGYEQALSEFDPD